MTASHSDHDFSAWALLLIDVQKDFWTRDHQQSFPHFEDNVRRLLSTCRQEGIEVIHLRSRFRADRTDWMLPHRILGNIPCIDGTPGVDVLPFAAETRTEKVFEKQTYDAFAVPELAKHLRQGGRRIVLTAGLETSYCVLFSSASACQQGFLTLMIEDCCADDPDFDRTATDGLLERYQGKVFWRTTLREITDEYPQWVAKLEKV